MRFHIMTLFPEIFNSYFGESIMKRAIEKGINDVVFDRGGYVYHGRVQTLAESAREAGLKF